jgi:hypothetical protein
MAFACVVWIRNRSKSSRWIRARRLQKRAFAKGTSFGGGPDQREQALRHSPLTLEVERGGQTLEIRMTLGTLELIPATDTPQVKPQNAATRKEA